MDFSYSKIMESVDTFIDIVFANRRRVIGGIIGVAVLAAAGTGYFYYNNWKQACAHQDFIAALRYYDAPVTGEQRELNGDTIEFATDQDKWKKVEEVFHKGYQDNRRSGLASIFRAYQASALIHLGKIDEAIEMLGAVVTHVPSQEVKDFYRLKLALTKLDSSRGDVQQEGFAELKKIAEDSQHFAHEAGLFYLGYYFWTQKDYAQVRNYWQQLMVKYGLKETKQQSGFADIVRSKLKLISADW